jgi:hypothetical protein
MTFSAFSYNYNLSCPFAPSFIIIVIREAIHSKLFDPFALDRRDELEKVVAL